MKNRLFISVIAVLFILISTDIFAEYIFTKDGKIYQGTIISETADDIILKNEDNITLTIKRNFTMRILYTEFYMGKVYVQQYNGDKFVVYMVGEDRNNYIFRKDINKPEEFKIERSSVKFISRANIAPKAPKKLTCVNISKKNEPEQYKVSWSEATDSDGKIKEYRLYRVDNKKKKLVKEFKSARDLQSREYVFKKGELPEKIIIVAIDNHGAESKEKIYFSEKNNGIFLQSDLISVFPDHDSTLYNLSEIGYGLNLKTGISNFGFKGFYPGLSIQFINFIPKSEYNRSDNQLNTLFFMPLKLHAGYSFIVFRNISLIPSIYFGGSLIYMDYQHLDIISSKIANESKYDFAGLFGLELDMKLKFSRSIYFDITTQYTIMYESNVPITYYTIGIGAGYLF